MTQSLEQAQLERCPECKKPAKTFGSELSGWFIGCNTPNCYHPEAFSPNRLEAIQLWNNRAK